MSIQEMLSTIGCAIAMAWNGGVLAARPEAAADQPWIVPAEPLWRLIPEMEVRLHRRLEVAPDMENQVICLLSESPGKDQLLDKIASATGGRWINNANVLQLVRDEKLTAAIQRLGAEQRGDQLAKDLVNLKLQTKAQSASPAQTDSLNSGAEAQTEYARNLSKLTLLIVESVGLEVLANLEPSTSLVYSTDPTVEQRQLPESCALLIRTLFSQRPGDVGHEEPQFAKFNAVLTRNPIEAFLQNGSLEMRLSWYDVNGQRLNVVSDTPSTIDAGDYQYQVPINAKIESIARHVIVPSPDDLRFAREFWEGVGIRSTYLKDRLQSPDRQDPLECTGDLLLGLAKAEGREVVASLPDETIQASCPSTWQVVRGGLSSLRVMRVLEQSAQIKDDGQWLIVSPRQFREMLDRRALAILSYRLEHTRSVGMSELGGLARIGYNEQSSYNIYRWLLLAGAPSPSCQNWCALKIIASLSPRELSLLSENRLKYSNLSPAGRSLINDMVFQGEKESGQFLEVTTSRETPGVPTVTAVPEDFRAEPTEALPNGFTGDERIVTDVSHDIVVRPVDEKNGYQSGLAPEELGDMAAVPLWDEDGAHIDSIEYGQLDQAFRCVEVGIRTIIRLRVLNSNGSFAAGDFEFSEFRDGSSHLLRSLPPAFLARLDSAADASRKRAEEAKQNDQSNPSP